MCKLAQRRKCGVTCAAAEVDTHALWGMAQQSAVVEAQNALSPAPYTSRQHLQDNTITSILPNKSTFKCHTTHGHNSPLWQNILTPTKKKIMRTSYPAHPRDTQILSKVQRSFRGQRANVYHPPNIKHHQREKSNYAISPCEPP